MHPPSSRGRLTWFGILRTAADCFASILLALAIPSAAARADDSSPLASSHAQAPRAEASDHFRRGVKFFHEGSFDAALAEFQHAYAIAPDYRVLYNLGQMHAALGENVAALRAYEEFLDKGGPWIEPARRSEVEEKLQELRERTARLSIAVNHAGATVWVDEEKIGVAPLTDDILLDSGPHRVVARTESGASASQELTLVAGEERAVSFTLLDPGGAARSEPDAAPKDAPNPALSRSTKYSIGLLGVAGALAIAGGGVALAARAAHDRHQDALNMRPGDADAIQRSNDQLARRSLAADILLGTGLAVGISGLALLLTKGRTHTPGPQAGRVDVRWALTPRALVVHGRF